MEKLVASEKKGGKILKVIENWGIRSKRVYNMKFSIRSLTLWKRNALFIVLFFLIKILERKAYGRNIGATIKKDKKSSSSFFDRINAFLLIY